VILNFRSLGRFMRSTLPAIFFALAATCATADEIDSVVTDLPNGWNDNEAGVIIMPQTASTGDVLPKVFEHLRYFDSQSQPAHYIWITNFTVLKTRQVSIPSGHYPGARGYSYTAVLIQSNCGEKVVLLRCFDVYTSRAWLAALFDLKPQPGTIVDVYEGTVEMPSGFTYSQGQGVDSYVGHFTSPDGKLVINYDIGIDAGVAALQPDAPILSSTNVTANGLKAIIVIVRRGDMKQAIVSFPKGGPANFFAQIRDDSDFELVKKVSLSYRLKPE
jgi:hypothetical protein